MLSLMFFKFFGQASEKQKNIEENIHFPNFSLYSLWFSLLFPNFPDFPLFLVPGALARRLGAAGDPRQQYCTMIVFLYILLLSVNCSAVHLNRS